MKSILVVDDSKLIHRMIEVLLSGYSLTHAMDGEEALRAVEANDAFDLILLDVNMPKMNGFEFLIALEDVAKAGDTPVIMVTTEGRESDAERGLSLGASTYLTKPFRGPDLLANVERLLHRVSERAAAGVPEDR